MDNGSSLGILGVIAFLVIVFLIIKFAWWILAILGVLVIVGIVLLIMSSKKTKGVGGTDDMEGQLREALSSIRRQKFKADAKINRLKEWANDAIDTTYGNFLGDKYFRTTLYEQFNEVEAEFAGKIPEAQAEKTQQIVNTCMQHMLAEKSKIETLDTLQKEHEELRQKLKDSKMQQRQSKRLDKHINNLNANNDDLSAEETIAKAGYTFDDLKQEVALKQEYVKQLEELSMKYGDNLEGTQITDYQSQLDELKSKI